MNQYQDVITPEMFFYAYEHHLVRFVKGDIKDIADLFDYYHYPTEKILQYFRGHQDTQLYTGLVEYMLEHNSYLVDLEDEVLGGHINMNILSLIHRARIIWKATNPEKVFEKMTPLKQQDTAGFLVGKPSFLNDKNKKIIFHYYKLYLKTLLEKDRFSPFTDSINAAFDVEELRPLVPELCEVLQQAYDKWRCQNTYPYTRPQFKVICGGEEEQHLGAYDYVSQPDAWDQRIVRQNGQFGLIDARGNVVLPPKFKSIGQPSAKGRVVLPFGGKPLFLDRDGNPKDH
jgi:hypothetical protein